MDAPLAKLNTSKPPLNPHEKIRFYKCQGFGHISSDCPNRRVITLREVQEPEEAELVAKEGEKAIL